MLDIQNVLRGACNELDCDCQDYTIIADVKSLLCMYCGHYPTRHAVLQKDILSAPSPNSLNGSGVILCAKSLRANPEPLVVKLEAENEDDDCIDMDEEEKQTVCVQEEELSNIASPSSACSEVDAPLSVETFKPKQIMKPRGTPSKADAVFKLPNFSLYVRPYLNGTAKEVQIPGMRKQLVEELVNYLESENLLGSTNTTTQSWGSRFLQRAILLKYPNIIQERSKRKKPPKGELGHLMSRILETRRRRKGKPENRTSCISPEEDEELRGLVFEEL